MGRPSLTVERRGEILSAFERCVLREGLANVTIQAVAVEAGVHRTLINHYFGDMESLVRTLLLGLTDEMAQAFRETISASPGLPAILDFLFRRTPSRIHALIGALRSSGSDVANEPLARMYEGFTTGLSACLHAEIPRAPISRCRSIAFAVVCLSMSRSQLLRLGVSKRHLDGLRGSAEVLIESLRAS